MSGLISSPPRARASRGGGAPGAVAERIAWLVRAAALLVMQAFGTVDQIYMAGLSKIKRLATTRL